MTPDLLLITHNRLDYVKLTLQRLAEDPADYRIFWWDNNSSEELYDYVQANKDPRFVKEFRSPCNVGQGLPSRWLIDSSDAKYIGKVDDDTLVPKRWTERIIEIFEQSPVPLGMIGCWTYWPEDYDNNAEDIKKQTIQVGKYQIARDVEIGGTAFLMERELAKQYLGAAARSDRFPLDRVNMSLDGYLSGWVIPILWAEHMDDPRSEHCLMTRGQRDPAELAVTAKCRGIRDPQSYLKWIQDDVNHRFAQDFERRILRERYRRFVRKGLRWIERKLV